VSADTPDSWTGRIRHRAVEALPPERALPDRQPVYVSSWTYVFGVATIASLVVIVLTGIVLALRGPTWWHVSSKGRFVNSMHLWSVELMFVTLALHIWAKFFMGAWRGGRGATWVVGAFAWFVAIGTAFTGYLSQQNFASQWIAVEAKDGLNAAGVGSYFNVLNFGQIYTWHVVLLPLAAGLLVGWHLLQVRYTGVVPPYPARERAS
jgi:ubiquinol-cytochrome c reductase cytochrome b subunit